MPEQSHENVKIYKTNIFACLTNTIHARGLSVQVGTTRIPFVHLCSCLMDVFRFTRLFVLLIIRKGISGRRGRYIFKYP